MRIGRSALSEWLRIQGWTFKKSAHALELHRPDILRRRRSSLDGQLDLDPAKLAFMRPPTKMARLSIIAAVVCEALRSVCNGVNLDRLHDGSFCLIAAGGSG